MPTKNSATIIKASDIRKTYGKKSTAYEALRGVNLDIQKGECSTIVDKSGSGKSTLTYLPAGTLPAIRAGRLDPFDALRRE